ncbi:MAG: bifunctional acetate--CoA ligase family protein/GNAT family N-acetyltransferase [Chlamydiota bacterium]|nr:bifunctional acetate--CoA ligase family protein/GNAT family N-acetyltransferase [Chlamydiota bacterium]
MHNQKKSHLNTDPSQNFIARPYEPLDAIFQPQTVAVIGAKDNLGSVGRTIMANLCNGKFAGTIYPINPKRSEVLGVKAYPSISKTPEPIDLAVIVTPAKTVPAIIKECVNQNVKAAIIISAGFKEIGTEGLAMEQEVISMARQGNMPVIGPNCLGVMNPINGLNATFAKGMSLPGNIAFISQSGAMCTAVLDWSFKEGIGFSSFVSIGSMADVNWGDLIHYLGADPNTHSILMYMETVGDARSFLTAAREIALEKPIIIIKGGRSDEAAKAAASHTGSLAGSDEVFDAALLRAGVLRVNTISELFDMASVLARQPIPRGPNLAIITNAGGPSVLATDTAALNGAKIAKLSEDSLKALDDYLPPAWSHSNPVDILGDAGADRYGMSVELLSKDPNVDGLLVVLSPQDVTDPVATAECLRAYSKIENKPILASWMGGDTVSKGIHILNQANIPTFDYPDDAAWSFAKMWEYSENLQHLYNTPALRDDDPADGQSLLPAAKETKAIIDKARNEGRTLLDEFESKRVLACYDIPVVETLIATSQKEAATHAENLGYPVVLKLFSQTITHKTDVGGVILNLKTADAVVNAYNQIKDSVTKKAGAHAFEGVTVQRMVKLDGYELILGSSCDEQFGPVLLFGTGGQLVEVFKDRALALPPLNANLAKRLMEKTKIYEALKGVRGREAIDIDQLTKVLVHFSQLIVENPWIKELDINPILVSPNEIVALDARIVLHDLETKEEELPIPSIRPYPIQYIHTIHLKDNTPITLRPIKAQDEPLIIDFHKELSEKSVRQRYFEFLSLDERTTHERLIRICFNDYDQELALVAIHKDTNTDTKRIIGVARLSCIAGTKEAKMTLIIIDNFHGKGLGTKMIEQLIDIAKTEKIHCIKAEVLAENEGMIHICKNKGFSINYDDNKVIAYLSLEL